MLGIEHINARRRERFPLIWPSNTRARESHTTQRSPRAFFTVPQLSRHADGASFQFHARRLRDSSKTTAQRTPSIKAQILLTKRLFIY